VQYTLARALIDRKITIEHFEGDGYLDPQVRALMAKVDAAPYTTEQFPAGHVYGAEVRVTLRGGTVLTKKVDQAAGRTAADGLAPERLKEKFESCANRALPAERTSAVYTAIMQLEKLADVRAVNNATVTETSQRRTDTVKA
jgi:2-methylcitrate dehydratase PrpD